MVKSVYTDRRKVGEMTSLSIIKKERRMSGKKKTESIVEAEAVNNNETGDTQKK